MSSRVAAQDADDCAGLPRDSQNQSAVKSPEISIWISADDFGSIAAPCSFV